MTRWVALLLVVGALCVLVAAFLPISMKVYPEGDQSAQLRAIRSDLFGWRLSMTLFGMGGVVSAAGITLIGRQSTASTSEIMGSLAGVAAVIASAAWLFIVTWRWVVDPERVVEHMNGSHVLFVIYVLGMVLALLFVGVTLWEDHGLKWAGGVFIAWSLFSAMLFLVSGDIPPFVLYIPLLVVGVLLLLRPSPAILQG